MKNKKEWIKYIGAFCLGSSLSGIFGLLDGATLAIAIIIMIEELKQKGN